MEKVLSSDYSYQKFCETFDVFSNYSKLRNILVVDDEADILSSLKRLFSRKFKVFTASSAEDAIEVMKSNYIQVIISDERMPDISGTEFLSIVKNIFPDTARLILTGYADIDAVVNAINEGSVFRYINKPWNIKELEAAVEQAFEKHILTMENKALLKELKESNGMLEAKVRERTEELEKLNSEKNRYISMVAHDLRSPLASVLNIMILIREEVEKTLNSDLRTLLNLAVDALGNMMKFVEDLFDVKRIESGNLKLKCGLYNVADTIDNAILINSNTAKEKKMKIVRKFESDDLKFSFDLDRIMQVLNNYISNAVKYSYPGSDIYIDAVLSDDSLKVIVHDSGVGISKEEYGKLFKEFGRASSKPTAGEKSVGLGLAISKKIIEAHGGTVGFESEPGKGSSFYFIIPSVLQ